jgi:pSer/pThr/pTyr-binding forkhead associated (FHA) protein
VGDRWELVDERLSHNGSHVNGERVDGRRGLKDGDVLRFGETAMLYRAPTLSGRRLPSPAESASTATRPLADGPS